MKTREYFCTPDGNIAIRIDDQVRNITTDDVDESNFMHFEKVPCPMRGECPHESVICQPEFNTALTAREYEILAMIVEGLTDAQIADRICRSFDTIRNHRKNIEHKLKCNSKVKLVEYARKNNLI